MTNRRLFRPARRTIALLVLLSAGQASALIGFILLLRRTVDELSDPTRASASATTMWALAGVALLLALAHGLEYGVTESVGYSVVQRIRLELYDHLTRLPPRSVLRSSRGALLLRFTGDLSTLRTWISRGLARGVVSGVSLLAIIGLVFYLDIRAGLAAAGVLLVGAALSALAGDRVRRAGQAVRWRRSLLASNVAEQLGSLATIQLFGHASGERARFTAQNDDLTRSLHRVVRTRSRLRFLSSATVTTSMVAAIAVGSSDVLAGRATVGTIIGVITALRFASGPVRALGLSHEYWQAAQVSKRKLRDFLARTSQVDAPDAPRLRVRSGEVVLRGITVKGVLDSVDVTAHGGEMLAIVGPNGAGKSTLVGTIARLVLPQAGEVLIDGQPIVDCRLRSLYHHVGMVSPDLPLMRGTLR
ncbi:MAG: ABC transporter ATP-binding protein/permease, partial [Actinobacteria bacterium]|nr:ABC transporter ATP-binding protein/permease [Actinomycetota bacterium]